MKPGWVWAQVMVLPSTIQPTIKPTSLHVSSVLNFPSSWAPFRAQLSQESKPNTFSYRFYSLHIDLQHTDLWSTQSQGTASHRSSVLVLGKAAWPAIFNNINDNNSSNSNNNNSNLLVNPY